MPKSRFDGRFAAPKARFEWGAGGALALAQSCAVVVVVDVLSFTTSVVLAVGRGTELFACASDQEGRELAGATGSELAVSRHEQDAGHPWSLSPASIAAAPTVERLVLPSPNGSAISALVARSGAGGGGTSSDAGTAGTAGTGGTPVVAACLRNASAVVAWLLDRGYGPTTAPIGVIAAGERWPDGSLRPAIEDLFGAGLVLAGLRTAGIRLLPEATVAARSVLGLPPARLADLVRASTSGLELRVAGYGQDVELAVEVDADTTVPVMAAGTKSFRAEPPALRRVSPTAGATTRAARHRRRSG